MAAHERLCHTMVRNELCSELLSILNSQSLESYATLDEP